MITREEAKKCFDKIYGNTHASETYLLQEEFSLLDQFINQQPQLSDDIEAIFEKANKALQHDFNDSFDYRHNGTFLPQLEQHILAQASEIERLKSELDNEISGAKIMNSIMQRQTNKLKRIEKVAFDYDVYPDVSWYETYNLIKSILEEGVDQDENNK